MSENSATSGELRRMIRDGLVSDHIRSVESLVDNYREAENEVRSLHLRYGMTGLGRLEHLRAVLEALEQAIQTSRDEHIEILPDLVHAAQLVREGIIFWTKEVHRAFEDA